MIIAEFAKYLQEHDDEIINNKTCMSFLCAWLLSILERHPLNKVERVVHTELALAKNESGEFLIVAKSPSGQKLTNSLYNFALSYEQHLMTKWLHERKADDFNKN